MEFLGNILVECRGGNEPAIQPLEVTHPYLFLQGTTLVTSLARCGTCRHALSRVKSLSSPFFAAVLTALRLLASFTSTVLANIRFAAVLRLLASFTSTVLANIRFDPI